MVVDEPSCVPPWLVGRWKVDDRRLGQAHQGQFGDGIITVRADGFAYRGFTGSASIFDESWSDPVVTTTARGYPRLDCRDHEEAWLEVRERDADQLVVYLGGVDVIPWGYEIPVVRVLG